MYPGDLVSYDVECDLLYKGDVHISLNFPSANEHSRFVYVSLSYLDAPLFAKEEAKAGEKYGLETFHRVSDYKEKALSDKATFAYGKNRMELSVYLSNLVDTDEIDITFSYAISITRA